MKILKMIQKMVLYTGFSLTIIFQLPIFSCPIRSFPVSIVQPNGIKINCYISGDEYHNWYHDEDNYTIIQDTDSGFYVYAQKTNGVVVASEFIVGETNPKLLELEKNVNISSSEYINKKNSIYHIDKKNLGLAPHFGVINNIVVLIRFKDENEFSNDLSLYDNLFNNSNLNSSSLYNYFKEVSYNQLNIYSHFYPIPNNNFIVSYQDEHDRSYYQPFNLFTNPGGYTILNQASREQALLKRAIEFVQDQIPTNINVDNDNDDLVDNVTFIIKGSPDGWSNLLWPHRWVLYLEEVYINGKRVYDYNFQLNDYLYSSGVSVLCHEMFHSLGAPDLYHYSEDNLNPVYKWDIMEYNLNPPQHMSSYMKYKYGLWIENIPSISTSGSYSLNPSTSSYNNCYRINSPNSNTEYFILEYRKKTGIFESSLPGEGLLIFRVNSNEDGKGNQDGPPDELYVYRPDGSINTNGNPEQANFSQNVGRTSFSDVTNPSCFLSNGNDGGIMIYDIGSSGNTISFSVSFGDELIVWPGDANNDGIVNVADVLPLGIYYNKYGPARDQNGCNWEGVPSLSWDPVNATYADCNGDGQINVADVLCIGVNYGKQHTLLKGTPNIKITGINESNDIGLNVYDVGNNLTSLNSLEVGDVFDISIFLKSNEGIIGLTSILKIKGESAEIIENYYLENFSKGDVFSEDAIRLGKLLNKHSLELGITNINKKVSRKYGEICKIRMKLIKKENFKLEISNINGINKRGEYFKITDKNIQFKLHNIEYKSFNKIEVNNYPNPFNPSTKIQFKLPHKNTINLTVFNSIGEEVEKLIQSKVFEKGIYEIIWNGKNYPSGIYIYILEVGNKVLAKKILLMK